MTAAQHPRADLQRLLVSLCVLLAGARACADGGFVPATPAQRREEAIRREIGEPDQKALLIFAAGIEDLTLQVKYADATGKFAWLVPTPARPTIGKCRPDLFLALSELTTPPPPSPTTGRSRGNGGFGGGGGGGAPRVEVLERVQVGYYDVSVLDANDADALVAWLNEHGYSVSDHLTDVLADYIQRGWRFTAARIDLERAGGASAISAGALQPLRLIFPARAPVYPLKISSVNRGQTEILLYTLTDEPIGPMNFTMRYQRLVPADALSQLTGGYPGIDHSMWLTKLFRRTDAARLTADRVFPFRPAPREMTR